MKIRLFLAVVVTFITVSAMAQSQSSLGDYARAIRKGKPAPEKSGPKVYDNDTIPRSSSLSVVGAESVTADQSKDEKDKPKDDAKTDSKSDSKTDSKTDAKSDDRKKPDTSAQINPGQSPEDRQKAYDSWKQKIGDQKKKVDLSARELEVAQREYRLKTAEFYANTASRVQNPNGFLSDDAKYKKEIAEKQKAVDAAKSQLSDLQDQAHKEGVPNSVIE